MVSELIGNWYRKNSRKLPWREDKDPYKVWVSEIILQQTRVIQGVGYYNRFLQTFPTIFDLADANIDTVMKVWQGLGYYSRARNLHQTAKFVVENYHGVFPDNIHDLLKLKGIGDYSAAALLSIAYNKPYAAVDGNVYRILSRYYGIDIPINSSKGKKYFAEVANEILDQQNPGQHNQAIMELGALICIPVSPHCPDCPLSGSCFAGNRKLTSHYPVKNIKKMSGERFINFLIIIKGNRRYIRQRPVGDIWAMLYEFPQIETKDRIEPANLIEMGEWKKIFPGGFISIHISREYKHQLTHRTLFIRFYEVEVNDDYFLSGYLEVDIKDIQDYALPIVIQKYLKQ